MKGSSLASRPDSLVCPVCELDHLEPSGHGSMRCQSCGAHLSGAMLMTLQQITALPDALGSHTCEECGHPQMRRLPDGVFHCPACGSEVLPLGVSSLAWESEDRSEAYRAGWLDGHFGQEKVFTRNRELARWPSAHDRLDYYRGHRAGSEARQATSSRRLVSARSSGGSPEEKGDDDTNDVAL